MKLKRKKYYYILNNTFFKTIKIHYVIVENAWHFKFWYVGLKIAYKIFYKIFSASKQENNMPGKSQKLFIIKARKFMYKKLHK
jgi:hypothetical protein